MNIVVEGKVEVRLKCGGERGGGKSAVEMTWWLLLCLKWLREVETKAKCGIRAQLHLCHCPRFHCLVQHLEGIPLSYL